MLPIVCALGALQLLLIAAAFAFARTRPRRILAIFAATVSLVIAGATVMETDVIASAPHLARVHLPLNFAIAPLFYLLAMAVLQKPVRRSWLHGIAPLLCALSLMPFYTLAAADKL